jgi:hypothetical protein
MVATFPLPKRADLPADPRYQQVARGSSPTTDRVDRKGETTAIPTV